MDTDQFAAALNRRMRDQIIAIDDLHDTYVLHLRNNRKVSVSYSDLDINLEEVMQAVQVQVDMRPTVQ